MRTSLDFPDELFRHLKTLAAQEGSTLRELVISLVERGLTLPEPAPSSKPLMAFPSISLGAPMAISGKDLTNARLFESYYDDE